MYAVLSPYYGQSTVIMASPTHNNLRSRAGRDLTCHLCHEHYKNPKLLPCLHTFCQECLEESHNDTKYLSCPSCQTRINLGNDQGVAGLQPNFLVKNMLDLLAVNLKEAMPCQNCEDQNWVTVRCAECAEFLCQPCADGHRRVRFTRNHSLMSLEECEAQGKIHSTAYCPKHEDGILKLFCETCQVPMCRDCTIVGHPIALHEYRYVDEAFETCKDVLSTLSTEVDTQIPSIVHAIGHLKDTSELLDANKESVAEKIHSNVEKYVTALRKREEELVNEMERIYNRKRQVLSRQKKKLETDLSKLKIATEFTNKILIYGSPLEVLGIKKQLSQHLENLKSTKLKGVPPAPQASEQIEFRLSDEITKKLMVIPEYGDVVSGPLGCSNATIVDEEGLKRVVAGKQTAFTIKQNTWCDSSEDEDDESCLKIKSKEESITIVDITEEHQGIYRVAYVPNSPGDIDIAVLIKDEHIQGSPLLVSVYKEIMYDDSQDAKKFILGLTEDGPGRFTCPYGVTISPRTGDVWVTDSGNDHDQVHVFASNNKFRFTFGKVGCRQGQFNDPADITFIGDGKVAVVDRGNHRVQIFTVEGNFVSSLGNKGVGDGQLCYPTGIAASHDGTMIAVCDNGNKRLQLFKQDGTHCMTIGEKSLEGVLLSSPWNAAVNSKNELVVTDSINHYVLVFDCHNGKLLRKFGSHGDGSGQFNTPTGVATDVQNNILVVDRDNNRVQVFSSTGTFIGQINNLGIDGAEFFHPGGICVSPFGSVVIADCLNKCVEVFQF